MSSAPYAPPARHLLRAKDLVDVRYSDPLDVDDMARAANLSRAHFSREFRRAFGESPHANLLTRRLERAGALLRSTDRSTDNCQASYEELKGRGVEFVDEPTEQPYGIDSSFRDPSGNHLRLTQVREIAAV